MTARDIDILRSRIESLEMKMGNLPAICKLPKCDTPHYCASIRMCAAAMGYEENGYAQQQSAMTDDEFRSLVFPSPMSPGLSLRDYFIAAALPRCIEVAAQFITEEPEFEPNTRTLSELMRRAAGFAVFAADAVMLARKETQI